MRIEVELTEGGVAAPEREPPRLEAPARRPRIDRFDLGVLAVFAAVSVWVLGLDLWQVVVGGRVWTGTDGFYIVDQMQYLAWIQEASKHLLVSNLFVLHPTSADYFQPAVAISGGLTALGMAPWLSLLLWKPVAVLGAFFAVRAFVRHNVAGLWARRAALVLALFFASFSAIYGQFGVVGDLWLGFESWGYTFGLVAIALMVVALLAYGRGASAGQVVWAPGLLGALTGLLHPWQGELLIVIIAGSELAMWNWSRPDWRRLALPAVTVVLTLLPLLYYEVLAHVDPSWQLARDASKHAFPLPTILLAIVPLAIPAALAYRRRPREFLQVATRVWPCAALVVYFVSGSAASATPLHAFEGITIPLAVLAVEGVRSAGFQRLPGARLIGAVAVALATIPAGAWLLNDARSIVAPSTGNANFIARGERQALRYLANDPRPGGVLTTFYLGVVVPAETGRQTYVGDCLWSEPDCGGRAVIAQQLLDGALSPRAARQLVRQSGARFVLANCGSKADLTKTLGPLIASTHTFGCARVYEIA